MTFLVPFALLASLAAYGIHRRTVWAWWIGWIALYFIAGVLGTYSYSILYSAQTVSTTLAALTYVAGGALLWIPAAAWWGGLRSSFGRRPSIVPPSPPKSS